MLIGCVVMDAACHGVASVSFAVAAVWEGGTAGI